MSKPTMQSIANQLNISKVTVSKALNNQPGVSEGMRKKIIQTAYAEGYIKKEKTEAHSVKKVGIIIPKRYFFDNEFFYKQIYYSLLKESEKKRVELVLSILGSDDERNHTLPYNMDKGNPETLLICGEVTDDYFEFLSELPICIICIDFYKLNMNRDCVVVDNFYASFMLTSYLISKGHKKIGFVGNHLCTSSLADRYYGYLKALGKNKLEYYDKWYLKSKTDDNTDIDFDLPSELPTAFICHCDTTASDLIKKLQVNGIKVSEDISIAGFDNTNFSTMTVPQITSVDINKKNIAKSVMDLLFWRINNPELPPQKLFLGTSLIERDSVSSLNDKD